MASHYRLFPVLALGAILAACGNGSKTAAPVQSDVAALQKTDLKVGDGAEIGKGQMAVVQYTGWLYDAAAKDHKGTEFDSSKKAGVPFEFNVGAGSVIKGWDEGVQGMKVGGSRRLVIPSDMAYGDAGAGGVIPPGATLVFDVDLLSIKQ